MRNALAALILILLSTPWLPADAPRAQSLRGVVYDAGYQPLAGATLYLKRDHAPTLVTVSDLQGRYDFSALDSGTYKLSAFLGGRYGEWKGLELQAGRDKEMDLVLSRRAGSLPVRLRVQPRDGGEGRDLEFSRNAAESLDFTLLQRADIDAALLECASGSYELVLSSPGAVYVGAFIVAEAGQGRKVLHTSGMAVAGHDFLEALSEQALLTDRQRL